MFIIKRTDDPIYPFYRGDSRIVTSTLCTKIEPGFTAWASAAKTYKTARSAKAMAKKLSAMGIESEVREV